ncbi:HNH endonuclease [Euzebya pacifica]|uniref:HNH endonuclease n=1 Tax=Euzebya pacifica TaxID=1608957 RepID=UPI0013E0D1C1|nr:HNH endonuclease [Euzebya pacifica]
MTAKVAAGSVMDFIPFATRGERLFRRIRDLCRVEIQIAAEIDRRASLIDREELGSNFLSTTQAFSMFGRLMKGARWARSEMLKSDPVAFDSYLTDLILHECHVAVEQVRRILPLLMDALEVCDKSPSPALSREVRDTHPDHCIYCGRNSTEADGKRLTVEHVWPSSLGGDTDFENLAPACKGCNSARNHAALWTEFWFQGFHVRPRPSQNEVETFDSTKYRIAVMLFRAERDSQAKSLKEALYARGPIQSLELEGRTQPVDFIDVAREARKYY